MSVFHELYLIMHAQGRRQRTGSLSGGTGSQGLPSFTRPASPPRATGARQNPLIRAGLTRSKESRQAAPRWLIIGLGQQQRELADTENTFGAWHWNSMYPNTRGFRGRNLADHSARWPRKVGLRSRAPDPAGVSYFPAMRSTKAPETTSSQGGGCHRTSLTLLAFSVSHCDLSIWSFVRPSRTLKGYVLLELRQDRIIPTTTSWPHIPIQGTE